MSLAAVQALARTGARLDPTAGALAFALFDAWYAGL
jgi:hypothetical protein